MSTNPTTQLVEAIAVLTAPMNELLALYDKTYDSHAPRNALLLAIADAVDTEIGENEDEIDHSPEDYGISYESDSDAMARNKLRAHMRTFTAGLREAAK